MWREKRYWISPGDEPGHYSQLHVAVFSRENVFEANLPRLVDIGRGRTGTFLPSRARHFELGISRRRDGSEGDQSAVARMRPWKVDVGNIFPRVLFRGL